MKFKIDKIEKKIKLKLEMFDLVILAGGKGTRIKKYLNGKPKPLIKILGYNF